MHKITTIAMAGALAAAAAVPAGVAQARTVEDAPDTRCQAAITVDLKPGISLQPSSGSLTSGGETGSGACNGPVNGQQTTAGGVGGVTGRYGVDAPNSCTKLDGKATFTLTATFPTENSGETKFRDDVTAQYAPLQGNWIAGGSFQGKKSYGTFKLTPAGPTNNCVVTPITKLLVQGDVWVVNGEPDAAAEQRMTLR